MTESRVRAARERAGFTQAELARRAGVSRALVAAVEAGRHAPAVDAALRLAGTLGSSAEALFGPDEQAECPAPVLGRRLAKGTRVRAGRVGERLVVAAAPPLGWVPVDGVLAAGGELRRFAAGSLEGAVVAGCDPALAILDGLAGRGAERLVGVAATTGEALRALAAGRCHGALVHGHPGSLPAPSGRVARWHVARWRVGIGFHPSLRHPSLEALLAGEVELVRRAPSAASDQAAVRAARGLGLADLPAGPRAAGHVEAACRADWSRAAAVTYEPAAAAFSLGFAPLETHVVELWVAERWRAHPGITALLERLSSRAFRERVPTEDGYDLEGCGCER
jgi:transcriptional regulator with XRE-family HTH domain